MDYLKAIGLLPTLVAKGKATEALSDIHILLKDANPLLADQTLWTDKAKILATIAQLAKSGQLGEIEAATFSLANIVVLLLQDPAHSEDTLDLLKSLVPASSA